MENPIIRAFYGWFFRGTPKVTESCWKLDCLPIYHQPIGGWPWKIPWDSPLKGMDDHKPYINTMLWPSGACVEVRMKTLIKFLTIWKVLIPVSGHQLCHAPIPPILIGVNTSIPKKSWWMMLRWPWNFPFQTPCTILVGSILLHLPGSRDHLKMAQQLFQLVGVSWPWRATWDPLGPLGSLGWNMGWFSSRFGGDFHGGNEDLDLGFWGKLCWGWVRSTKAVSIDSCPHAIVGCSQWYLQSAAS